MKNLFIFIFLSASSFSFSQSDPCYFDKFNRTENLKVAEQTLQKYLASKLFSNDSVRTIPVVVHVIHNGGTENISDAQIQDAIDVLNEDFGKLPGTNGDGNGVDTKVRFCLAKITPEGNCTNGIVRIRSTLTNHKTYERPLLKQLSFWDNTMYLNIYVVKSINGGVLGYASFPGGPAGEDGVVVRHNYFGRIGTSSSLGRTLTHEVGHWLGLYHTFNGGCGVDECNDGDYVCDTPPVASPNFNCPTGANSCTNDTPDLPDQIENYMDYTNDACKNMFTNGQKQRILATLDTIRNNIATFTNLIATGCDSSYTPPTICQPVADFVTLTTELCVGNSAYFMDKSLNNIIAWEWMFEGANITTSNLQNPTVQYDSIGVFDVRLIVTDTNGFTDTLIMPDYITVTTPGIGTSLPFSEDFESGIFPNNGITINNPDGGITWELDSAASTSGMYSIKINNLINTNYGTVDEVILPTLNLQTISNPVMRFNWAYAKSDPSYSDELIVQLSIDCEATFQQIFYRSGTSLATGPTQTTPFVPDSTQWKSATINLGAYAAEKNVVVKIVNVTDGGNNLYIDDINISGDSLTSIYTQALFENSINIYPNPTDDYAIIQSEVFEIINVVVYTITGEALNVPITKKGKFDIALDLTTLSKGIYIVKIMDVSTNVAYKRLIVN